MDTVNLEIHFDGKFGSSPNLKYIGDKFKVCKNFDVDRLSYFELLDLVKEDAQNQDVLGLYFKPYNADLDVSFIKLHNDKDVMNMLGYGCGEDNKFEIYSEHKIEEFFEIEESDSINVSLSSMSDSDEEVNNVRKRKLISHVWDYENEMDESGAEILERNETTTQGGERTEINVENENDNEIGDDNVEELKIVFDEDKYKSDDEDRICLDEIEEILDRNGVVSNGEPYYDDQINYKDVELVVGMKFSDHRELKHAIKSLAKGFVIKYVKSESTRLLAVCGYPDICKWRLWATKMTSEESFQIRTLNGNHTCIRDYSASIVDSTWLAKEYARRIRDNPNWKLKDIQADVFTNYGLNVTLNQCWRAKQKAVGEIEIDLEKHYAMLFDYAEEIQRTNPGSRVVVDVSNEDGGRFFKRVYICFAGIKNGWKENCRKVIGLDGCWLKGKCKGELLSAIGRDANEQMYPICWAVVEGESYDSWNWFIRHLLMDLGPNGVMSTGHGWTIISDQQKGLIKSVFELLPDAEHRNCARHIYANFKKKWNGAHYRKLFWEAAKSSTKEGFGKAINKIQKLSKQAYEWLIAHDPNVWSRAFFSFGTKCTNIENNMCEVFNGSILSARDKLIISMLEDIRRALLDRVQKNLPKIFKNDSDTLCPRIRNKLEDLKAQYRFWTLKHNCEGMFEIFLGSSCGYVVNMREKTCSCNMWQLSGIPCVHAISAIYYGNGNPDHYVDIAYTKETYKKTYRNYMQPLNGSDMWPKSNLVHVLPPMQRRMPGRPKKARRKEMHEDEGRRTSSKVNGAVQLSKRGVLMTCSNCENTGHNKKTCKNPPKEKTPGTERPKNKGGRPKIQKPVLCSIPRAKKKKNANMGIGLYTDPKTGKTYLNGYLLPSGAGAGDGVGVGSSAKQARGSSTQPTQTIESTQHVQVLHDTSLTTQLVDLYKTLEM